VSCHSLTASATLKTASKNICCFPYLTCQNWTTRRRCPALLMFIHSV